MEKSMFEMKVKEAIKPMEEICDILTSCTKAELSKGIECVDTKELGEVLDGIKDMCEAKEKVVKALYYSTIGTAMEENADDYGETWNENGKMYYRGRRRDSMGRYMYTEMMPEEMRHAPQASYDMRDDMSNNMMYGGRMGEMTGSHISRRGYMETKENHKGNSSEDIKQRMQKLEKYLDDVEKEVDEMSKDMTPEEITMKRTRLSRIANK